MQKNHINNGNINKNENNYNNMINKNNINNEYEGSCE